MRRCPSHHLLTVRAVRGYRAAMVGAMAEDGDGSGRGGLDWASWIKSLGRQARRVREFLGLSQEQVARVAGVSQGAVSRFEGGRGLATPLLVVMKVNAALRSAVSAMTPDALSIDGRRLLDLEEPVPGQEEGEAPPIARDPRAGGAGPPLSRCARAAAAAAAGRDAGGGQRPGGVAAHPGRA